MTYPLVRDLAADGIPVTVACRVLGFSRQAFYAWDIDAEGGLPYYQSPGLERLWILDVDGELVVINLSDGKRLALAMVNAIEFVPSD